MRFLISIFLCLEIIIYLVGLYFPMERILRLLAHLVLPIINLFELNYQYFISENRHGINNAGPNNAGPNNAGPNNAGPNIAGPNIAGPNIDGPNVAGSKLSGEIDVKIIGNYKKQ